MRNKQTSRTLVLVYKTEDTFEFVSNYHGIKFMTHMMKLFERVTAVDIRNTIKVTDPQLSFYNIQVRPQKGGLVSPFITFDFSEALEVGNSVKRHLTYLKEAYLSLCSLFYSIPGPKPSPYRDSSQIIDVLSNEIITSSANGQYSLFSGRINHYMMLHGLLRMTSIRSPESSFLPPEK